MQSVMESPAAANLPPFEMQRNAIFNEARELAEGSRQAAFNPHATALAPAFDQAITRYSMIGMAAALLLAFAGGLAARVPVRAQLEPANGDAR
jgi:phosphate transport system permease protein